MEFGLWSFLQEKRATVVVTIRQHVRAREHSWKGEGLFPRYLPLCGDSLFTLYWLQARRGTVGLQQSYQEAREDSTSETRRGDPRLRAKFVTNLLLRSRTNTIELESLIKPHLAPTGTYEELEISRCCSRISSIIKLTPSSHLASAIHIKS